MRPRWTPSSSWDAVWNRVVVGVAAVDAWQQRRWWSALPVAVVVKFQADRGGQWSALLAHYAFLSLLPVLLVLVTALGYLLAGSTSWQQQILDAALADVPVLGQQLEQDVTSLRGSLLAVLTGLVVALYGSGGVLRNGHQALDDINGTPAPQRSGYLPTHGRVVIVGVLLLVVTLLAALATSITSGAHALPGVAMVASLVTSAALGLVVLLSAFRVLASERHSWRAIAPGAVVGALAWTGLHALGGIYVDRVVHDASLTYGTFAIVIGLIAWMYLQAQVFLYAAELNSVLEGQLWPRSFRG